MRFQGIEKKIQLVGFDKFSQAGYPNKFHPMNIVCESKILNQQFWVCVEGGPGASKMYHIAHRQLDNYNAPSKRIECRTQKEMISVLESIRLRIAEAKRLQDRADSHLEE